MNTFSATAIAAFEAIHGYGYAYDTADLSQTMNQGEEKDICIVDGFLEKKEGRAFKERVQQDEDSGEWFAEDKVSKMTSKLKGNWKKVR